MATRLIIAYALIALMAAFVAALAWHWWTRDARLRRKRRLREQTMRERWLRRASAADQS